ncbi:hypothetical protein FM042_02945 [Aliidiomarina halalkaliphila]|uniref:Uncharacterized protein n=1 Tax=Aliidiomarina halalkaliphila TaxID=2593535 RepID=A0A552X464_9GAMM|nr:hypothetical protein [Aliidiomarina halalkaliphila]TRW49827.1 hypothetical protein FM042_02945 [Aliidiomarina halalkaliphila]
MKHTSLIPVGITLSALFFLNGCDATDAANYSLASECYNRYPNDSWAQQQCFDQGVYNREVTHCQNETRTLQQLYGNQRMSQIHNQSDRYVDSAWQHVEPFDRNINSCLASSSYDTCFNNVISPALAQINQARQYALYVAQEENTYTQRWNGLLNQCSRFTSGASFSYRNSFDNSDLIAHLDGWTTYINQRTATWRRHYNH